MKPTCVSVFSPIEDALALALRNLIDNAVKYSPEFSPVDVCHSNPDRALSESPSRTRVPASQKTSGERYSGSSPAARPHGQ